MKDWEKIMSEMVGLRNEKEAAFLMRFFKCGNGEYGEGDQFLGIRVPVTRGIVRHYKKSATLPDAMKLTESQWHEIRLAGFLLMIEIYKKSKGEEKRNVVDNYLGVIERGNNWDLVDLVAPKILGDWLAGNPQEMAILDQLAEMDDKLWHQRVAMVANWMLIRKGVIDPTFRLAEKFLTHKHDLMHKASGWMLREAGKKNLHALVSFLDSHAHHMPRTMLRYAIEKLDEPTRKHYMTQKNISRTPSKS